ncbi:MAG: LytTR family DNA-binding domain-containing protein [Lysinibacillus sp.]
MKIHLHIDAIHDETEVHIYATAFNEEIEQLMNRLNQSSSETIIGYKENDIYVLKIDAIFSISIEDAKVFIQTDEDEFECRLKLYELEDKFPNKLIRINKSTLVNIDKIMAIQSRLLNTPRLILTNEVSLSVSRKYLPIVKTKLGVIHGGEK